VPVEGQPARPLVNIKSSGVTFELKTNKVSTDQPASFTFENGTGKSVGASYDATARELYLRHDAEVDWKAPGPRAAPMKIEAGELIYKEAAATIWLNQWSRLTRQNTLVNAGSSVVQLQDGVIRQVDAVKAEGTDEYPRRKLQYAADELRVTYNDDGEVEHVQGRNNARLVSVSEGAQTTMSSDLVVMDFETLDNQSVLKRVLAMGNAAIESKPPPTSSGTIPETRVVRSQTIELQMRPGGREIEMVQTHTPGTLDFIPNQPNQRPRRLTAERMGMIYGPGNQLQSFRASNVGTETEPSAQERAKKRVASKTRSKGMTAEFDPKTGQMKRMEQWDGFLYEEGDRRARADHATLDADNNLMTLTTAARIWDAAGATSADRIDLDQKTGDFKAEGHAASSRQPEKNKSASEILSGDEAIEALADRMNSSNHNRMLEYDGHVVMWQGADRIAAGHMIIDREKRTLSGSGGVLTQFLEKQQTAGETARLGDGGTAKRDGAQPATPQPPTPTFVVVKAAGLVYTEQDRVAHYTGGVLLDRPGLRVKADELQAFLAEQKAGEKTDGNQDQPSRLEKAYADGHVEIVQTAPDRTRTGTGEYAEYYTTDEHIVLRGEPQLVDSKRGYTRGAELTYYVNDARLLVSGSPQQRATGRLRRRLSK
jgi:lipopolysaccharide export system protein LptA